MINKIDIASYGILENTSVDCKKYNLIFGYNGSGKTTLARLLKNIEIDNKLKVDGQYEVFCDNNNLDIRVFIGKDYIKENIWGKNKEPILFSLGKDSVDLEKEKENLKQKVESLTAQSEQFDKDKSNKNSQLEAKYTNIANEIKNSSPSSKRNYNKKDVRPQYEKNIVFNLLSDDDFQNYKIKANATIGSKEKITPLSYLENCFKEINSQLESVLKKEFSKPVIFDETAKIIINKYENSDYTFKKWWQEGRSYESITKENKCPFCQNNISNILKDIKEYFEDKTSEHIQELDKVKNKLEIELGKININISFNTSDFFEEFTKDIENHQKLLNDKIQYCQKNIEKYISFVQVKINSPYSSIDSIQYNDVYNTIEEINNCLKNINNIIDNHNTKVLNFDTSIKEAVDKIEEHILAIYQEEVRECQKLIFDFEEEINKIKKDITSINKEIQDIDKKLVDAKLPIDEFNRNLSMFLGRNDIELYYDENNKQYKIIGNGKEIEYSEGEITAISLLHFLLSLKDSKNKKPISDYIVVIDDPISSLDSNSLYSAYSFIESELSKKVKQVFILTHHFYFFKKVQKWMKHIEGNKNYSIKHIVRNKDNSIIDEINEHLRNYESEYQFICDKLSKLKNKLDDNTKITIEELIVLPNTCRKVLEAICSFLYPYKQFDSALECIKDNTEDNDLKQCVTFLYRISNSESHIQYFMQTENYLNEKEYKDLLNNTVIFIEKCIPTHFESYKP